MLKKISCIILFILFFIEGTLSAYDKNVIHRRLSRIAAENSVLALENGNYLRNIGFEGGLKETFLNNKVDVWIQNGSTLEDENRNYFNHFHNPLKEWQDAGLDIDLLFINPLLDPFVDLIVNSQSSLLWAQDSKNEFSWQNVREYFYDALTTGSEESFAKTFEGLGHIIHLLQDAAQPAHVRNDAHPLDGLGLVNGLETWAKNHPGKIEDYASSPEFPTVDLNVYIYGYEPITQFFDTDTYTYGTNPSTTLNQGIAEYTNANFASDDTIFTENFSSTDYHYFPFPRREDTVEYDEYNIEEGKYRTYFKKIQNGEKINHLAAMERIYKYLGNWPDFQRKFIILDSECHKDYAQKLIPRAVGYSAGLINYFFRGQMEVFQLESQPSSDPITEVRVKVKNVTPNEETGTGEIVAVASSDDQVLGVSRAQMVTLTRFDQELVIDFKKSTIPTDAPGLFFTVVYRGPLGLEEDAVIASPLKVCEPDFIADVIEGTAPLTVKFTITNRCGFSNVFNSITLFDGEIWDFGDGGYSTENSPIHVYTTPGEYTVRLKLWQQTSFSILPLSNPISYHKSAFDNTNELSHAALMATGWSSSASHEGIGYSLNKTGTPLYKYFAREQYGEFDFSAYTVDPTTVADGQIPIMYLKNQGTSNHHGITTNLGGFMPASGLKNYYKGFLDMTPWVGQVDPVSFRTTDTEGYSILPDSAAQIRGIVASVRVILHNFNKTAETEKAAYIKVR